MSWPLIVVVVAAGIVATFWTLHLVWRLQSVWRIRRAGPREGLVVSGATEDEAIRCAGALFTRIRALHEAVVLSESREARPDEGRRTIQTA